VAKKKGSRKTASRGARKTSTSRRRTRKAAEDPKQVNLKPVKAILTDQIKRLQGYEPRPDVENALKVLTEAKAMLSGACLNTRIPMVIEFK